MSLRTRLLSVSTLTMAVGLGALLIVGNVLLDAGVRAQARAVLRGRVEAQISALHVTHTGLRVRETTNDEVLDRSSWVLDGDRVVERPAGVPASLDRVAVDLGRRRRRTERDAPGDFRLLAMPVAAHGTSRPIGAVVSGYSTVALERLQRDVLLGSLVLAGLVLFAGAVVTRSAVNGALRPVALMTEHAEDWSAHDLERRFGLGPSRDELTGLAATLDGLLARIAASRRHEQRFASEVAHELRTPIAGLRGRAELALAAEGSVEDRDRQREAALETVVREAGRLDAAIDALVAVARGELNPAAGSVDLASVTADIEDVDVVSQGVLPLAEGEPEIVRRALGPLLDNARRHARTRVAVELTSADGWVRMTVVDDGPGLDPSLGDRAFDPGVQGTRGAGDGAGLGLALARRLARSCGGDVRAEPGPGGRFVLELPAVGQASAS